METSLALAKKYAAYALAGAALGVPAADAAVMYVNPPDTVQSSPALTPYDLDGDLTNDYSLALATPNIFTAEAFWFSLGVNKVAVSGGLPVALQEGQTVDASLTYGTDALLLREKFPFGFTGNWPDNLADPRFVGLQFQIGAETHYGWARIGVATNLFFNTQSQAIVYDWAFESDPDTPITIAPPTAIPEPSTFALFALGAAGVAALKRRRSQA
jgi:hypothetical protein